MNNELSYFGIPEKICAMADRAMADILPGFAEIDRVAAVNSAKVLAAFSKNRVSESCFAGTTGYGYDDKGRDTLDQIYADVFHTEAALVRTGFVNGTHAITAAIFACLRPGDVLLAATGIPYDTLQGAIGITGDCFGSLKFYGIGYAQVELNAQGKPDIPAILAALGDPHVRAVELQRSRGYSTRGAFSSAELGAVIRAVHEARPDVAVIVDNCYGEFVDTDEPTDYGADLIAGSLIKNPGGGLAPMGGYIAGRRDLVENAAMRLTTPGIGGECGATLGVSRALYQGLFMAPHIVAQAVKTAVFCARMMELMGYESSPRADEPRHDIIQMIRFGQPEPLLRFCRGIQAGAPVDAFVTPEPWEMPGYDAQVVMAAGAFIQGASIELSCDGPMREPYCAYLQGGLTFEMAKIGIMIAAGLLSEEK